MSTPVTVTVSREADTARADEALAWLDEGLSLARGFDGYLGGGIMRDAKSDHVLHVVYTFRSRSALDRWDQSEQRKSWSQGGAHLATVSDVQRRTGIEGWFDGARIGHSFDAKTGKMRTIGLRAAPPRWKQAAAIWIGMLPLNITASFIASKMPWWGDLSLVAHSVILVSALVPVMTFLVMPAVTRVLRPWLRRHPGAIKSERALQEALAMQAAERGRS